MIDLQENMDKQGIKTTQKGVCDVCQKPIIGQVITALGTNLRWWMKSYGFNIFAAYVNCSFKYKLNLHNFMYHLLKL